MEAREFEIIINKLSETLELIETILLLNSEVKPCFPDTALRTATYIFMSVMLDKMYDLQRKENLDLTDKENMTEVLGNEIRRLIKTFTNIDSHEFYIENKLIKKL